MRTIRLKKREDRRIQRGHPWVFSNEIVSIPSDAVPGEVVDVVNHDGRFVGRGMLNPRTLITVRILSRQQEPIDETFIRKRITNARNLRERLGIGSACRVFFSESDGLPGLIVDRYADSLVVQLLTAGAQLLLEPVTDVLRSVFSPRTIVLRNDSAYRTVEGLPIEKRVIHGETDGIVTFEESGISYTVDVLNGQKTGFFFDQRENRLAIQHLVEGRRVLDCFCYVGAWALTAAKHGAADVIGVDASSEAIRLAEQNAVKNDLTASFIAADVFEKLREYDKQNERFGCIVLDPPAFVKNRAKVREALKGYKEINQRAMRLLEQGGTLATCSCSHHIDEDLFREMLIDAAYSAGRQVRLLEMRSQARDHPVLLAARETQYLKCAILTLD